MALSLAKRLYKLFFLASMSLLLTVPFSLSASAQDASNETVPEFVSYAVTETTNDLCAFDAPKTVEHKGTLVQVKQKHFVEVGGEASVAVTLKNESNVPWFSHKAGCGETVQTTWLGTTRKQDRISKFYSPGSAGWYSANRIEMLENRVNPGQMATFKFTMDANVSVDVYREHFSPLIDGQAWLEDIVVAVNLQVGTATQDLATIKEKRDFLYYSNSTGALNLDGERYVMVDLSKQRMFAKIDNVIVKEMRTSTGAHDHPTPQGPLKVAFKDRVRIGGAAPHYIMQYFMALKWDHKEFNGYGIHDFPAYGNASMRAEVRKRLANGEDYFDDIWADDWMWKNAHYDMGKAVSHGCIRNDDARFVYDFLDVDDRVFIYPSVPDLEANPMLAYM